MLNVLFVCIGNSCRSQMAEGFARKYGGDLINTWSAGLAPAAIVQPQTIEVMRRKNIDINDQFPKSVYELELNAFHVIFNISGVPLPVQVPGEVRIWDVIDPMTQSEEVYLMVRDQIEGLVMQYLVELRQSMRREMAPPVRRAPRPKPAPAIQDGKATQSPKLQNVPDPGKSSQRFGFGRVRRARD